MPERKRLIVDIGCGAVPWPLLGIMRPHRRHELAEGSVARGRLRVRELRPNERYIGLDLDRRNLELARTIAVAAREKLGAKGRFEFLRIDVNNPLLPLRSGVAHEVHLHSPHQDPEVDPQHLLSEMHRVLRRGGQAYLTIDPLAAPGLASLRYVHGRRSLEALGFTVEKRTTRPEEFTPYTLYARPFTFHLVLRKR